MHGHAQPLSSLPTSGRPVSAMLQGVASRPGYPEVAAPSSDADTSLCTAASLLAPTQARQTGATSGRTPDAAFAQLAAGQTQQNHSKNSTLTVLFKQFFSL